MQVQALRSIEKYLALDKLYVLGTNCVDNGPREGLEKFLNAASDSPSTVLHYEFVQDYRGQRRAWASGIQTPELSRIPSQNRTELDPTP